MFNHVVRPKVLKVCSYVEKYAEFKNQTLIKKIRWYTNWLYAKEYPRVIQIINSLKMRIPYDPTSNLTSLAPPGEFDHWDPLMSKKYVSKTSSCLGCVKMHGCHGNL